MDSESALSQQNIDTLTKLVKRHEIGPNGTNDAIVDLYDAVTALINRETEVSRPPSRFIFGGK